jgi:DivIVA domain-containing protein
MAISSTDAEEVRFSKPRIGKRGYHAEEVDRFLELVADSLAAVEQGNPPLLSAKAVHNIAFSKPRRGERGYHEDEVDAFLDLVEATLTQAGRTQQPAGPPARPRLTAPDVRNAVFGKPSIGRRGYHEEEVDTFLDTAAKALTDATRGIRPELTGDDIRNATFNKPPMSRRGYHEDEVDHFLELVEIELRRLTAGRPLADPPAPPKPDRKPRWWRRS